jgi:hypothetical protein
MMSSPLDVNDTTVSNDASSIVMLLEKLIYDTQTKTNGEKRKYLPHSDMFTSAIVFLGKSLTIIGGAKLHSIVHSLSNIQSKLSGLDGIKAFCDVLEIIRLFVK